MEGWQLLLGIAGMIATIGVCAGIFLANGKNSYNGQERRNNGEALKSYQTLLDAKTLEIEQLRTDIKELHRLHTESIRENGKLQGQIEAYARLPLQEISNNQRIITQALLLIAKHDGIEGIDILLQDFNRPSHINK